MINITTNNKQSNYDNNISHVPTKLSPYDNIKKINRESAIVIENAKKNIILKNIANRRISSDNLKKLYHITSSNQNIEDNACFVGKGGNGVVYLISKLNDQSVIDINPDDQVSCRSASKKKSRHYILSVSKLGITKEFILHSSDYLNFEEYVGYAKEELEYNILMGLDVKLFIDRENRIIQLVSEYKGSTLDDYIHYKPLNKGYSIDIVNSEIIENQNLCDGLTRIIARQIISLILTFHNKTGCVHGDIKSSNILVNQLGEVTVIDFGAVVPMNNNGQIAVRDFLGTVVFAAPEIFEGFDYVNGKCLDVYSIGLILLYIMLKEEVIFVKKTVKDTFSFNYGKYNDTIEMFNNNTNIPRDLKQIILGMLAKNPKKRLSLEQSLSLISSSRLSGLSDLELEFEKQITMKKLTNLKRNKSNLLQNQDKLTNNDMLDIIDCSKDKSMLSYNKEQKHLEKYLEKITKTITVRTNNESIGSKHLEPA